jgi:hypothetical protein
VGPQAYTATGTCITTTLHDLPTEALDFISGHAAKLVVEGVTGLQLLAVDQQRVGPGQRIARGLIEIPEEGEAAVDELR